MLSFAMTLALAAAAPPAAEPEWMLTITSIKNGEVQEQYGRFADQQRCEEAGKAILSMMSPNTDLDAPPQAKCTRFKK